MTSDIKQVLSTKNEILNTNTSTKYLTNNEIQERVTILATGLVSDTWIPWYCKAYKTIGESRFCAAVSMAKTGKNPQTLFGWLLKQEMSNVR